jgi:hypothetical protein
MSPLIIEIITGLYLLFVFSARDRTQSFVYAKQALYNVSNALTACLILSFISIERLYES